MEIDGNKYGGYGDKHTADRFDKTALCAAYGEKNDTVYCHLFAAGKADFSNGMSIECTTDYPYGMSVKYKATGIGRLTVRIPKWSRKNLIRINGSDISPAP